MDTSHKKTKHQNALIARRFKPTKSVRLFCRLKTKYLALWGLSYLIWVQPSVAQTTTWAGAFDNVRGMGESGSELLNMFAVLIGSGMAIFGWIGLTSETKKQQRGVMGSIILIVVGALLIVWRVVVQTNVGQIFGEGTDVPFLDN